MKISGRLSLVFAFVTGMLFALLLQGWPSFNRVSASTQPVRTLDVTKVETHSRHFVLEDTANAHDNIFDYADSLRAAGWDKHESTQFVLFDHRDLLEALSQCSNEAAFPEYGLMVVYGFEELTGQTTRRVVRPYLVPVSYSENQGVPDSVILSRSLVPVDGRIKFGYTTMGCPSYCGIDVNIGGR